ncbi:uncharacterized protein V1477_015677 [Vespula maculifrons]|uniref:Uncharacterized protein n=1 Tax=Vespula maculifrons TaxID=7453 RepID=A0ABD2BAU8_VESMC
MTDFDSYWFSYVLYFDEYTSQFLQEASGPNNNEELIQIYWGYSPTRDDNISGPTVTGQSCFEFRRVRIAGLAVNILRKFKLGVGILGLVRRQQSWSFD